MNERRIQELADQIRESQKKEQALVVQALDLEMKIQDQESKVKELQSELLALVTGEKSKSTPTKKAGVKKAAAKKAAKKAIAKKPAAKKAPAKKDAPSGSELILHLAADGQPRTAPDFVKDLAEKNIKLANIHGALHKHVKQGKLKRPKSGENKGKYIKA